MAVADRAVRAKAPGKINVYLGVGALQDDGFHEIATAYQAVSLCEIVEVELADDLSVRFSGPIDTREVPAGSANLAVRAAQRLQEFAGVSHGATIRIEKHIPVAGGMGGASADAAAVLVACDELWGTGVGRDDLLALGAELGPDVPFALQGGTAIGTGRGDELSPALAQGTFQWVLAINDHGLPTPAVYQELDEHRARHVRDIGPASVRPEVDPSVLHALRAGDPFALAETLHNDLQAAALHLDPTLGEILELGESNGALAGLVTGSGPTVAFLCADRDSALGLQIALSAAQVRAAKVTGPVTGARLID